MIGKVNGYIEEKNGSKYLVFDSADIKQRSTKKYIMNFEMGLKMRLRPLMVVKQVNMIKISWKWNLIQMMIYRWINN